MLGAGQCMARLPQGINEVLPVEWGPPGRASGQSHMGLSRGTEESGSVLPGGDKAVSRLEE